MSHSPAAFYTIEEEEPETITLDPCKYGDMTVATHGELEAFFVKQGATEAEAKRWTGKLFEDRAPLHCAEGSRHFESPSAFEPRIQQVAEYEYVSTAPRPPPRVPSPPTYEEIPYEIPLEERWEKSREYWAWSECFHASRANASPGYDYYQPEYRRWFHSSQSSWKYPQEPISHHSPRPRSPVREPYIYTMPDRTKSSSSRRPRPTDTYSKYEADCIDVEYDPEHCHHSSSSRYRCPSPPRRYRSTREPPLSSTKHESSSYPHKSDESFRSEPKRSGFHRESSHRDHHSSRQSGPRGSDNRRCSNRDRHPREESHRPSPHNTPPFHPSYHSTEDDYEDPAYARGQWQYPNIVHVSPTYRS